MITGIEVPEGLMPAEKFREFCVAQLVQSLLVKHGVDKHQATTILAYVLLRAYAQVECPPAVMGSASNLLNATMERIGKAMSRLEMTRADIQLQLSVQNPAVLEAWAQRCFGEPLVFDISDAEAPGMAAVVKQ